MDAHDPGAVVIPVSGALESKLLDMEEEERNKYCEEQKTQRWDIKKRRKTCRRPLLG